MELLLLPLAPAPTILQLPPSESTFPDFSILPPPSQGVDHL
jgi:hypothetical protein